MSYSGRRITFCGDQQQETGTIIEVADGYFDVELESGEVVSFDYINKDDWALLKDGEHKMECYLGCRIAMCDGSGREGRIVSVDTETCQIGLDDGFTFDYRTVLDWVVLGTD